MKPLSTIIPFYNVEKYLPEHLLSIHNQTYENFQVIVVNDGSTDKTLVAKTRNVFVFKDSGYTKEILNVIKDKERGILRKVKSNELSSKIELWKSVFDVSLIKDLRFPNMRFAKDVAFGVCANFLARKIANAAVYFYRTREDSLTKNTHLPIEFFEAFKFIYDFFLHNDLLRTYTLPLHILKPNKSQRMQYPNYFKDLQDFIKTLQLDSETLNKNKDIKAILESNNLNEFLKKTQSFKEWRRENFRIHFSKKQAVLRIFGKTLY